MQNASWHDMPPTPGVFAKKVHKLLKTKGERRKNVQRVQKLLRILKMSSAEVKQVEYGGEIGHLCGQQRCASAARSS
jgi:hypothetical protein